MCSSWPRCCLPSWAGCSGWSGGEADQRAGPSGSARRWSRWAAGRPWPDPGCCPDGPAAVRQADVAAALYDLVQQSSTWFQFYVSIWAIGLGLAIGAGAGLVVAALIGISASVWRTFEPLLYYVGSLPKIIILPVLLLYLGTGIYSKVGMGAVSAFFPVAITAAQSMREVKGTYMRAARSLRRRPIAAGDQRLRARGHRPDPVRTASWPRRGGHRGTSGRDVGCLGRGRVPGHAVLRQPAHRRHVRTAAARAAGRRWPRTACWMADPADHALQPGDGEGVLHVSAGEDVLLRMTRERVVFA